MTVLCQDISTLRCEQNVQLSQASEATSVTRKKSPNVYKSWPKIISLEKSYILTPLQKLPKNVRDLGKLLVAKGFKKLHKVQKIAEAGHTGSNDSSEERFIVSSYFFYRRCYTLICPSFLIEKSYCPHMGSNTGWRVTCMKFVFEAHPRPGPII